jgi:hypothetical protein
VLFGYIVDPDTGKIVAVIRHGEVFRNDEEGARIATVLNANLYDLMGNFIGRLDDQHTIDVRTWSMPIEFRNLCKAQILEAQRNPPAAFLPLTGLCASSPTTTESTRAAKWSAFSLRRPRRERPGGRGNRRRRDGITARQAVQLRNVCS